MHKLQHTCDTPGLLSCCSFAMSNAVLPLLLSGWSLSSIITRSNQREATCAVARPAMPLPITMHVLCCGFAVILVPRQLEWLGFLLGCVSNRPCLVAIDAV